MVTWGGPTWNDLEAEQERLYGQPDVELESEPTESMMELWVSRAAVEMVVRAAATFASILTVDVPEVDTAIEAIQEAVKVAWEDPLDTTLL